MRLSWSKIAGNGPLIEFSVRCFQHSFIFFSFLVVVGTYITNKYVFFYVYLLYFKLSVDENVIEKKTLVILNALAGPIGSQSYIWNRHFQWILLLIFLNVWLFLGAHCWVSLWLQLPCPLAAWVSNLMTRHVRSSEVLQELLWNDLSGVIVLEGWNTGWAPTKLWIRYNACKNPTWL